MKQDGSRPVPLRLRDAPTKLMKTLDYGKGYRYAHDEAGAYAAGRRYLPDGMPDTVFYEPTDRGVEKRIRERLAELRAQDAAARPRSPPTSADVARVEDRVRQSAPGSRDPGGGARGASARCPLG